MTIRTKILAAGMIAAVLAATSLSSPAFAEGKERHRTSTYESSRGASGVSERDKVWDPKTNSVVIQRDTTHGNGKKSHSERRVTKTDTGRHVSGEHTGVNGHATTVEKDVVKSDDGSRTSTTTMTRDDGQTAVRESTTTKTDTGFVRTGTVTNGAGETATFETEKTKTEDGFTLDRTTTAPSGNTTETHVDHQRTDSGFTETVTHTDAQGQDHTSTRSVTFDSGDEESAVPQDIEGAPDISEPPAE